MEDFRGRGKEEQSRPSALFKENEEPVRACELGKLAGVCVAQEKGEEAWVQSVQQDVQLNLGRSLGRLVGGGGEAEG